MYTLEIPIKIKRQSGLGLILVILICGLALSLIGALTQLGFSSLYSEKAQLNYVDAFYLAEAGLEYAKTRLAKEPAWYTDLSHLPLNDKNWLKNTAWGASPLIGCKVVKEKNKNRIYAIGISSKSPKACVIFYAEYSFPPFKVKPWEEL